MKHEWTPLKRRLGALAIVLSTVAASCNSASGTYTTTKTSTSSTALVTTSSAVTTVPVAVTLELTAINYAFDKTVLMVPAGAEVTMNFYNRDTGVPHNFAAYTNSSATTSIFVGQVISGPGTISYKFTAPSTPGNYSFRCDLHTNMTGTFTVTP